MWFPMSWPPLQTLKVLPFLLAVLVMLSMPGGLVSCQASRNVHVAAAVSLKPVLQELQKIYPHQDELSFSFGASGLLKTQILAGAPFDVFLAVGNEDIQQLKKRGYTQPLAPLVSNPLTLARHTTNGTVTSCAPEQLKPGELAAGNPVTVPVGFHARRALGNHWQRLSPQLTSNAYQNIVYLRNGAVKYAVVYQSDLKAYPDLVSCWAFRDYPAIPIYALPLNLRQTKENTPTAVVRWLNFLQSPEARQVFSAYGFNHDF